VEPETKPAVQVSNEAETVVEAVPEDGDDGKGWCSWQIHVVFVFAFNFINSHDSLLLQHLHSPATKAFQYYITKISVDFQRAYDSCGTGILSGAVYNLFVITQRVNYNHWL
jgi:hypothetical protein